MRIVVFILVNFILCITSVFASNKIQPEQASTTKMLKSFLELAAARQEVLAKNMSNLNTPNYKAEDIRMPEKYSDLISTKANRRKLKMQCTNKSHISGLSSNMGASSKFNSYKINDAFETKPNGNNVSLPQQMFKVSQTQQDYNGALKTYSTTTNLISAILGK